MTINLKTPAGVTEITSADIPDPYVPADGTADITGNLDVSALIDTEVLRTALIRLEEIVGPEAAEAALGKIWVKNDVPNTLWFTDDAGTDHPLGTVITHALDGHTAATLAELNVVISDATLIDTTDSRLSDDRYPTTHSGSHMVGGADVLTAIDLSAGTTASGTHIESDGVGGWTSQHVSHALREGLEPTGVRVRTATTLSYDAGTLTFTITPVGASFVVYVYGVRYEYSTAQSVTWTDVDGLHYFYFNSAGVLTHTTVSATTLAHAAVGIIHWDATANAVLYFGDERHGMALSKSAHLYLHETIGARYASGLAPGNMTVDGDGSSDTHAQLSLTDGKIWDEDLDHTITDGDPQDLSTILDAPVFYLTGAGVWRRKVADHFPFIYNGQEGFSGTGRLPYNKLTGGTWSLTEIAASGYVCFHLFATNGLENPIISIQGQAEYANAPAARAGAQAELSSLFLGGLPTAEFVPLCSVILQSKVSYANTPKARVVSTGEGDYVDWRGVRVTAGAGTAVSDHGTMTGLLDDDHTQYQLLTGKDQASGYAGLSAGSKLTGSQQTYGTLADTACVGNDARLSDDRNPTAHALNAHTSTTLSGVNAIISDYTVAATDLAQAWTAGQRDTPLALDLTGATTAINATARNQFYGQLSIATTQLQTPSNLAAGQWFTIDIQQAAAGGKALTFTSAYDFGDSGAPDFTTLSASAYASITCHVLPDGATIVTACSLNALLSEAMTFFANTTISGAAAETLSDGSNADYLHTHALVGTHALDDHTAATLSELNAVVSDYTLAATDLAQAWTAGQKDTPLLVTMSGAVTIDAADRNQFYGQLHADSSLSAPTGVTAGQYFTIDVQQDANGGCSLTFDAAYDFGDLPDPDLSALPPNEITTLYCHVLSDGATVEISSSMSSLVSPGADNYLARYDGTAKLQPSTWSLTDAGDLKAGARGDILDLSSDSGDYIYSAADNSIDVAVSGTRSLSVRKTGIKLTEAAAAELAEATLGQWWVKNDVPNTPWFSDDAGTAFALAALNKSQAWTAGQKDTPLVLDMTGATTSYTSTARNQFYGVLSLATTELQIPTGIAAGQYWTIDIQQIAAGACALTFVASYDWGDIGAPDFTNLGAGLKATIYCHVRPDGATIDSSCTLSSLVGTGADNYLTRYDGTRKLQTSTWSLSDAGDLKAGARGDILDLSSDGGDYIYSAADNSIDVAVSGTRSLSVRKTGIKLTEAAAAELAEATLGQWWVKNDVPNTPWFSDDAGTAFALAALNKSQTWTAAQQSSMVTLDGSGATTTIDASAGNIFYLNLEADTTLANPTNLTAGAMFMLIVEANGTHELTYDWNYTVGSVPAPDFSAMADGEWVIISAVTKAVTVSGIALIPGGVTYV